jgi:hypothetical protein
MNRSLVAADLISIFQSLLAVLDPSEGRRAEDFITLKNPTASAGFEPANLGTKGQRANP